MITSRFIILVTLFITPALATAEDNLIIPTSSEAEITVEHFPAKGKYLIVWVAPEYGLREAHRSFARMLAQQNIEIWLSNILESLFLPQSSNSIKKLDGRYVADIIEYAHIKTGKKIILVGDSYGALSALIGAHQWQTRKQTSPYLIGAVLFTPFTYVSIPPLGQLPEYMPVVSATNIPLMIYQAKNNGNVGQFATLLEKLRQHGNPVYSQITQNVMSLFYEDKITPEIHEQMKSLPGNIIKIISILEKTPIPLKVIPLKENKKIHSGIDIYLKEYRGNITPIEINLEDSSGNRITKSDYTGKVTVLNFWATWCPPCVQEIPSLNRLKNKMKGQPFELISINYAEDKETIKDFMEMVKVEFPVLLDSNGDFARKWNVITYPSTFVIDKTGKIRYGVNAAIEWDDPEFINKMTALF